MMARGDRQELRDLADAVCLRTLDVVAPFLGYVRDPADRSRWCRTGRCSSPNGCNPLRMNNVAARCRGKTDLHTAIVEDLMTSSYRRVVGQALDTLICLQPESICL